MASKRPHMAYALRSKPILGKQRVLLRYGVCHAAIPRLVINQLLISPAIWKLGIEIVHVKGVKVVIARPGGRTNTLLRNGAFAFDEMVTK